MLNSMHQWTCYARVCAQHVSVCLNELFITLNEDDDCRWKKVMMDNLLCNQEKKTRKKVPVFLCYKSLHQNTISIGKMVWLKLFTPFE